MNCLKDIESRQQKKMRVLTRWFLIVLLFNFSLQLDIVEELLTSSSTESTSVSSSSEICGSSSRLSSQEDQHEFMIWAGLLGGSTNTSENCQAGLILNKISYQKTLKVVVETPLQAQVVLPKWLEKSSGLSPPLT